MFYILSDRNNVPNTYTLCMFSSQPYLTIADPDLISITLILDTVTISDTILSYLCSHFTSFRYQGLLHLSFTFCSPTVCCLSLCLPILCHPHTYSLAVHLPFPALGY